MKKASSIILLAAFASSIFITSCKKDVLDTSSPSEYTPELVFSSTAYTNMAITGAYSLLTQDQLYSARLPLNYATNSDIEFAGADENSFRENGTRGLSNYMGNADNTSIAREWAMLYKLVERANICIEGIKSSPAMATSDSTAMKGYLGEALTLRSLAYFELVKNWGDVPYRKESTNTDLSNAYLPVTDRDTIYDNIIADLQEAENYLPWVKSGSYSSVERVTKGFVKGLIARVALFRGGYSIRNKEGFPTERGSNWQSYYRLANQKCKEIIDNGTHRLNTSYSDIWRKLSSYTADNNTSENLFEVAHGLGRSGEMGYTIGVRFFTNKKYGFGNNAGVVNTSVVYFYSFDQKDLRRDNTVAYFQYSSSAGDQKENFITNPISFTFAKWDQRWMNSAFLSTNLAANSKIGYGVNWSIMRYSDVLLMYAETENALNNGPTAEAKSALKQVRRRAFATADQPTKVDAYVDALGSETAFFNAIVDERSWEFGGEAIRKYDLIRWNLLTTKIQQQRNEFQAMINETGKYNPITGINLPNFLYYKYEPNGEILDRASINFYEDKGTGTISGFTRINWLAGLSAANKSTYTNRLNAFSSGLTIATPNRHLYPIPSSVISESRGLLKNSYGF